MCRTAVHTETVVPFIIETFDKPDHQHVRQATRAAHLAFLDQHKALLLACGAKLADDGKDLGAACTWWRSIRAKRPSASSNPTRSTPRACSSA